MQYRAGVMIAALWWGSLSALGFIVVPMLFNHLPSPAAAGQMAAKLFTAQTWLSIACSMFLLLIFNPKRAVDQSICAQAAIKFIVTGLLLAVLVEFAVAPQIIQVRQAGAMGGSLKFWHALGSVMYFGQWLCAGASLWQLAKQPSS